MSDAKKPAPESLAQVEKAKLAEHAERFKDMTDAMKAFIEMEKKLNEEQRNLFSVAYKNLVGAKRTSWRILNSTEAKQASEPASDTKGRRTAVLKEYKTKVEKELRETCGEVIELLTSTLVPNAEEHDSKVFYHKMKGDYYRYMCEVEEGQDEKMRDASYEAYNKAKEAAEALPNTSPIRLGLALNFSVFLYEIVQDKEKACEFAKKAFDEAIADLDQLAEKEYKDSTLIMQLLRDNLTLWSSDNDGAAGEEQGLDEDD